MGVGDILIKNVAMLFKWCEEKPLWKKIVSSCNELNMDRPVWEQFGSKLDGTLASICSIWKINKEVESIVKNGLWVTVGAEEKNPLLGR